MSRGTRLLAIILGAAVAIAAIVVVALYLNRGWPPAERTAFIEACVKSCRGSPGVTADRYPVCDKACTCAADEAEKMVSARELTELYNAMQSKTATPEQNEKLEKMKSAGVTCISKSDTAK